MDLKMIVYILVMLILFILLLFKFYFRIRVGHRYKADKVVQRELTDKKTFLYKFGKFVDPITSKYIDRYTIIQSGRQKSCIVQYDTSKKNIKYYIYVYKKNIKIIEVLEIVERNCSSVSSEILLPKKCSKINIKVVEVDGQVVNKRLRKNSIIRIMFYSVFSTSFVFLAVYGIFSQVSNLMDTSNSFFITIGVTGVYFLFLFTYLIGRRGREVES